MNDSRPLFMPLKKDRPGVGWVVAATWPNGQVEQLGVFSNETNATRWIAEKSEGWLGNDDP
jgi:hypothetical protein